MKDYNFFQIYTEKGEKQDLKRLIYIAISTLVIALMVLYPLLNHFNYLSLKKEVNTIAEVLNSDNTSNTINRIEEKKSELERLSEYLQMVKRADEEVTAQNNISQELLRSITDSLPGGVYMQALNIDKGTVQIVAVADSKDNIAQLEFNLKANRQLIDVFIPSISLNNDTYTFTITANFKDVNNDED